MTNFLRQLVSPFLAQSDASRQTRFTATRESLPESQACYSRMRYALIEWRRETETQRSASQPTGSSGSPASSSDPDILDDFLVTFGREA